MTPCLLVVPTAAISDLIKRIQSIEDEYIPTTKQVARGVRTIATKPNVGDIPMITVKVIEVPGAVQEVAIEGNTVGEALNIANVTVQSNYAIKVNGVKVDASATVSDGDRIIVAKDAKGNS